ncbi:MAG: hypothetical protein F6J92_01460 [Symploca sp. SIO1A3]|nr:hypothetical protein [Symploca sp. SIO1A3]
MSEVGYIPLTEPIYQAVQTRFEDEKTGSVFDGGSTVGLKLSELYMNNR